MSNKDELQTPETPEEEYTGILGDYQETEEETPAPEEAAPAEPAAEKPEKTRGKGGAIAGIAAAVVAIAALGGVGLWQMRSNPAKAPAGIVDPENDAAYTEHVGVSKDMMQYFYYDYIQMFRSYYGDEMLQYYGMDLSQSLRSQEGPNGDGSTWYDLIMSQAKANVGQELVLTEAGRAAGFELPESDRALIDEQFAALNLADYGEGMTEEAARQAMELNAYAAAYYNKVFEDMTFTDEEIESYYTEHESEYNTCGLCFFPLTYTDPSAEEETTEETAEEAANEETTAAEETTEAETEPETTEASDENVLTKEIAEDYVAQFKKAGSLEAFQKVGTEVLVKYQGYSEEEAAGYVQNYVRDDYTYVEGAELSEWAFGGAKVGDVYVVESEGSYYAYYLTREPGRDEKPTIDVRHILFAVSDYLDGDASEASDADMDAAFEKARADAQACLDEWKAGEATEESFGKLAEERTGDPGSANNGGLYSGVTEGQMVPTFNDWCFDPSRKTGDTDLVETDYGVHVMYFVGQGDPAWKTSIIEQLKNTTYTEWYAEQEALYTVTFNDEILNTVGD